MSDYSSRSLRTPFTPAELASLYGTQGHRNYSPGLLSPFPGKPGFPNLLGANTKHPFFGGHSRFGFPVFSQDELIRRNRAASLGRVGLSPTISLADQTQYSLMGQNHPLSMGWNIATNGETMTEAARVSGSSSGSIWASSLDPNSKPFSPRSPNSDFNDMDSKDDLFVEKDSNANVVRNPLNKLDELTTSRMRRIWESEHPSSFKLGPAMKRSDMKVNFLAADNFPPLTGLEENQSSSLPTVTVSETEEEIALKSKYSSIQTPRARKSSTFDADEIHDQYGLRSLFKNVQQLPHEEAEFIEKVSNHFNGPVFNNIEGPFLNQVMTVLHDSYEVPDEYAKITTHTSGSKVLNGPSFIWNWPTELLFFFFYMATGDWLQVLSANTLYMRGWRYSKSRGVWIARKKNVHPELRSETDESGYYQYFDVNTWRREVRYFTLKYDDLADKVDIPKEEMRNLAASPFMQPESSKLFN